MADDDYSSLDSNLGGLLSGHGQDFVTAGQQYGVDPKLLAAISMTETAEGTSHLLRTRNNTGGITGAGYNGVGGNYRPFDSITDSIMEQARMIRAGYIDQGRTTIEAIGAKWAPVGADNDPNQGNAGWPAEVSRYYRKMGGDGMLSQAGSGQGSDPTLEAPQLSQPTEEDYAKEYDDPSLKTQDQFGNQIDPSAQPQTDPGQNDQTEKPTDVLGSDFMLQQLRQKYPQYGHATNDELLDSFQKKYPTPMTQLRALYPQYDDTMPDDTEFTEAVRQKFYPNQNATDFNEIANPPTGLNGVYQNALKSFWPNLAQTWHQGIGNIAKFPERADEGIDWLRKQDWIGKSMSAIGIEQDPTLRSGAKALYDAGKKQQKKAENVKVPDPVGISGHLSAVVGQAIGSAPEAVLSFMPGIGPAASVTLGMTYNAVTAAGDAKEQGKDDGLPQAFLAGGVRGVQQWILESPRGRLLTGVYNAALGMADERAHKFLNGDPDNDVDKTAAYGAVNFVIGVMGARGKEKLPVAAREEFDKAVQARDTGDVDKAKELLDKSQLFLTNGERNELGQLLLKWRDDVIPMPDTPGKSSQLSLTYKKPRPERTDIPTGPTIQRPYRTKEELRPNPYTPPPKFEEKMTGEFYYSGLPPLGDVFKDVREKVTKGIRPYTDVWHRSWDPENISEIHKAAGAIISEQNAAFADKRTRLMNSYIHKLKLEDTLRFEDQEKRMAFWKTFTNGQLKKFAEAADEGKPTGNKVVDRMIAINKGGYAGISKMEESYGITYPLRDSYIYRVLKHPEDIAKVEGLINRMRWGDPRFMHQREFDKLATLHKFGIELKTYNQEAIFQMRMDDSLRAISRVQALRDMTQGQMAIAAKDLKGTPKGFQDQIMAQSNDVRSPNGEHYWVHKGADFMLHRAWDPSIVRGTAVDKFFLHPLNVIKQKTVGMRLGLSLFHQDHMLDILSANLMATAQGAFLDKKMAGTDLLKVMGREIFTGGIYSHFKAAGLPGGGRGDYSRLLRFYHGKGISFEDLTDEEKWQYHYQQMGGLAPVVSHERELQFMDAINKHVPIVSRIADPVTHFGYKFLTGGPYQSWLFKHVIPAVKMAAYDNEVKALFDAKPWLMNPREEAELRGRLREIGKQVDSRFGEMNYDNLFWPKITKILGQNLLLSLGWKLGFWRIYAGAVHSLMNSAAHMDEIIKTYRDEGPRAGTRKWATNQVLYAMNYTALTSIKNLMLTAAVTGTAITAFDALYPRVGKNPDGTDKRLKTPYFTGELGALWELFQAKGGLGAFLQYMQNSTQPALSDISQLLQNKDYRGTQIRNPHDPLLNQIGEVSAHVLVGGFVPFSVEAAMHPKPGAAWTDRLLPFFGLPPAPSWTGRTDVENKIINVYSAAHGGGVHSQRVQDQTDARSAYREALRSKNQNEIHASLKHMQDLGMSPRSISNTEETQNQTTGERLLSSLDPEEQIGLLEGMTPDERAKYIPFASNAVQDKLSERATP